MSKAKPLTAEQCEAAREAMLTGHSLSKISRCAGVVATIEYMLTGNIFAEDGLCHYPEARTDIP